MAERLCRTGIVGLLLLLVSCENQPNAPASSAPAGERKSLKEVIKTEAGKVADAAREGAATVAESAKEVAHVAKEEALEIAAVARDLARSTRDQTVIVAQQRFDEARIQLDLLKEQKDRVKEALRPEYEKAVAELSDRVANLKERVGELRETAPDAWQSAVNDLAPVLADVRAKVDSAWDAYMQGGHVRGSVSYLERMLLPENAEMTVRLLDVSRSESEPEVIAQESTRLAGAPPFAFDLRFDPAKTAGKGTYAIDAEIRVGDKREFATPGPKRIAIGDAEPAIEIIVKRAK